MHEFVPEDQLHALSPRTKMVVGTALALTGAIAVQWFWDRGILAGLPILSFVIGMLLASTGREQRIEERELEAELARAEAEWDDLREAIRARPTPRGGGSRACCSSAAIGSMPCAVGSPAS